jgi:NTP pyrophosphatase (non-canonical NTP hydrolase)
MMDYFELECCVSEWAKERDIFIDSTPIKQALKTQEELTELMNAIINDDREEIEDSLGDIMVTLLIQAEMQGTSLEECLTKAFNVISKRKGKMIDGHFVKNK